MKERIIELITKLNGMRDQVLEAYLLELERFTPGEGNPQSVVRVGILHDLDKHVTNLELEVQRLEVTEAMAATETQTVNASETPVEVTLA